MTADGPESGTHQASSWTPVLLGAGAVGGLVAIVAGIALAAAPPPATPVLVVASATSTGLLGYPSSLRLTGTFLNRDVTRDTERAAVNPVQLPISQHVPLGQQFPHGHADADRSAHLHSDRDSHGDQPRLTPEGCRIGPPAVRRAASAWHRPGLRPARPCLMPGLRR